MVKKDRLRLRLCVFFLGVFLFVYPALAEQDEAKREDAASNLAARLIARKEIGKDSRFIAYDDGTVLDTSTNLMWAAKDNGSAINWANAKAYCENYRGGGYTDWRMPTQDELEELYDSSKSYKATQSDYSVNLTELIQLSTCCPFASETSGSEAAIFMFFNGTRYWVQKDYESITRALPVRSGK